MPKAAVWVYLLVVSCVFCDSADDSAKERDFLRPVDCCWKKDDEYRNHQQQKPKKNHHESVRLRDYLMRKARMDNTALRCDEK